MPAEKEHKNPFLVELHIPVSRFHTPLKHKLPAKTAFVQKASFDIEINRPVLLHLTPDVNAVILGLSEAALRMLFYIISILKENTDMIELRPDKYAKKTGKTSRTTFTNAKKELCRYEFIKKRAGSQSQYWINPRILYRGQRKNKFKVDVRYQSWLI